MTSEFLFSTDNSEFSGEALFNMNDAASALLFAKPDGVDGAEWRKSVADALTNVWQEGLSGDDLADLAAARLGIQRD